MRLLENGLKHYIPHVIYKKVDMDPEVKVAAQVYCKEIETVIPNLESRDPVDSSVTELTSRMIDAAYRAGLADGFQLHSDLLRVGAT